MIYAVVALALTTPLAVKVETPQFTIALPDNVKETDVGTAGISSGKQWAAEVGATSFEFLFSDSSVLTFDTERDIDRLRDDYLKGFGAKLSKEAPFPMKAGATDVRGRDIEAVFPDDGALLKLRIVGVGHRSYVLAYTRPASDKSLAPFDEAAKSFTLGAYTLPAPRKIETKAVSIVMPAGTEDDPDFQSVGTAYEALLGDRTLRLEIVELPAADAKKGPPEQHLEHAAQAFVKMMQATAPKQTKSEGAKMPALDLQAALPDGRLLVARFLLKGSRLVTLSYERAADDPSLLPYTDALSTLTVK